MEEKTATHSSILAWEVLWTEESGRLLSIGSQRVGHTHTQTENSFQFFTYTGPSFLEPIPVSRELDKDGFELAVNNQAVFKSAQRLAFC